MSRICWRRGISGDSTLRNAVPATAPSRDPLATGMDVPKPGAEVSAGAAAGKTWSASDDPSSNANSMKSDTGQCSPNWPIVRRDQAKKIRWEDGREALGAAPVESTLRMTDGPEAIPASGAPNGWTGRRTSTAVRLPARRSAATESPWRHINGSGIIRR